jgi:GT2 family glycosyltransferase
MIDPDLLQVVIPTRDRAEQLLPTLDALAAQSEPVAVVVVDQSETVDARLRARVDQRAGVRLLADSGRGLSRARNTGWRVVRARWIAFLDDDCRPEPDWAARLLEAISNHPDVAAISGHVADADAPSGDYLPVTPFHVEREAVLSGARLPPWHIGMGVFMTLRRDVIERLGGWDERLGAGTSPFPSSEDMDFNYRLLRSGERAYVSPDIRLRHWQWRAPEQLPALFGGYMAGWSGFAMKQLRQGDVSGGVWLWSLGARDAARMLASAVRRRSRLRLRVAATKLRGLASGTVRGLLASW